MGQGKLFDNATMKIESGEFRNNAEKKEILSQEDKDMVRYVIEDLRAPTQNILKQLHNQIERGEYTIIIGDDTSGRIPTIIIGGVIKELYGERNFPSPLIRFIAGGIFRHMKIISEFNEFVEKLKIESEKQFGSERAQKILIVTEFMNTGQTLESLLMNFKVNGMPCDVAAIGNAKNVFQRFRFARRTGSKVMRGQKEAPDILRWNKKEMSGLVKDYKHLFSESFRNNPEYIENKSREEIQAIINEARENAKKLTFELVEWYKKSPAK